MVLGIRLPEHTLTMVRVVPLLKDTTQNSPALILGLIAVGVSLLLCLGHLNQRLSM